MKQVPNSSSVWPSSRQKCAFLKVLPATLVMVVMKTEMRIVNNNEIKGNEVLMLATLSCTLLHNQNDGRTVP